MTRIGINGFGRIGRLALRAGWARPDLQFVHINEVAGGPEVAAHLLTFDSVHGRWPRRVDSRDREVIIDGTPVSFSSETRPGDVAWSFDASSIAYLKDVDGVTRLAVARTDGSDVDLVFPTFGPDEQPSALGWSPDSMLISFVSTHGAKTGLFVVHPDGSGLQRIPVDLIHPDMGPITWAPDATQQRIAFVVGDNASAPSVVRAYDLLTQKHTWIGEGFWPTWSPDGAAVACECGPGGIVSISFQSALAGAPEPRRLQPDPTEPDATYCQEGPSVSGRAICSAAQWSPDGRWIAGSDVLMHDLVLVSTDGLLSHVAIHLDSETGPGLPIAWQPLRS